MRIILLLITLVYSILPACCEEQYFVVFRRNSNGIFEKRSSELWMGKSPIPEVNIPRGARVYELHPVSADLNPNNYEIQNGRLEYAPPQPELVIEREPDVNTKARIKAEEKASDDSVSDAKWLKLFRASQSKSEQKKQEILQEMEEVKDAKKSP